MIPNYYFFYLFLMVTSVCVQRKIIADTHGKNLHGPATHIETNKTVSCKGAQVWDFPSLGFSWFLHKKGSLRAAKFLMRMLSLISMTIYLSLVKKIFCVELLRPFISVNSSPWKWLKILTSLSACSELYAHGEHTRQEQMRMLSIQVRNWCAPWSYTSVPCAHAQHTH